MQTMVVLRNGFRFQGTLLSENESELVLDEIKNGKIVIEKASTGETLRGLTAHPGCVRGIIKIVLRTSDIGKVQKGDILVSSMTRPEMTSAMQKAAAFVTDEGGITCHAAIIAREMNKPCIIGTRTATKTFKEGDLVEVDANKGIIQKIK